MSSDNDKKKRSDKRALDELSDGIEEVEPVQRVVPVWKPKLGDLFDLKKGTRKENHGKGT